MLNPTHASSNPFGRRVLFPSLSLFLSLFFISLYVLSNERTLSLSLSFFAQILPFLFLPIYFVEVTHLNVSSHTLFQYSLFYRITECSVKMAMTLFLSLGSLGSEATALSILPQPMCHVFRWVHCFAVFYPFCLSIS